MLWPAGLAASAGNFLFLGDFVVSAKLRCRRCFFLPHLCVGSWDGLGCGCRVCDGDEGDKTSVRSRVPDASDQILFPAKWWLIRGNHETREGAGMLSSEL